MESSARAPRQLKKKKKTLGQHVYVHLLATRRLQFLLVFDQKQICTSSELGLWWALTAQSVSKQILNSAHVCTGADALGNPFLTNRKNWLVSLDRCGARSCRRLTTAQGNRGEISRGHECRASIPLKFCMPIRTAGLMDAISALPAFFFFFRLLFLTTTVWTSELN